MLCWQSTAPVLLLLCKKTWLKCIPIYSLSSNHVITCTHLLITWTPNNSSLSRVPVKVWIIGSQLHLMKRKLWISFSQKTYSANCCSLRESFSFLLSISFPDPNGTQRKGTVFITGTVDSVIHARAQLIVRKRPFTKCMPIIDIYNCNALPMNFQWNPLLLPPYAIKLWS